MTYLSHIIWDTTSHLIAKICWPHKIGFSERQQREHDRWHLRRSSCDYILSLKTSSLSHQMPFFIVLDSHPDAVTKLQFSTKSCPRFGHGKPTREVKEDAGNITSEWWAIKMITSWVSGTTYQIVAMDISNVNTTEISRNRSVDMSPSPKCEGICCPRR